MKNLSLKQKKIIVIILVIIALITYYYFYTKNNTEEINNEELEIGDNEIIQEESKEKIIIHITGAVNKEGIVELEENARLADAIEKAGGTKENADISSINLATILEDGMKIHIPTIEETKSMNQNNTSLQTNIQTEEIATNTKKQEKININTADEKQLDTLPGIGPSTASKIIEYRKEKGKFKSIEEIKEVSGIGDAKFEKIKNLIKV